MDALDNSCPVVDGSPLRERRRKASNFVVAMSAMAKKQKQKAEDFLAEADKLLNKKSWFSSGRERNAEEAAELYMQAANAYKVGGLNQEAGDTYVKAGEMHRDKLANNNEAAKCFSQAGTEILGRARLMHLNAMLTLSTSIRGVFFLLLLFLTILRRCLFQKKQRG